MNRRLGFGICAVFLLGVAVGHVEGRYFKKTAPVSPASMLRISAASERGGWDRDGPRGSDRDVPRYPHATEDVTPPTNNEPRVEPLDEPAAAFAAVLAQPDGDTKLIALRAAFTRWLLSAPEEAMNSVDRIPVDLRETVVAPALGMLAAQQPTTALRVLDSTTENYATYAAAVLGALAKTDPQRALDWAHQNADRDPGGEMMRAIIPTLASTNLDMAAHAVATMGDRAPASLIQQVAAEYAARDPQRAYEWARDLARTRPTAASDEIMNGVSAAFAARSVDTAAAYLNEVADPQIRASLIREVSNRKSVEDLQGAWTWLNQYRAEASYAENARNLLSRWSYLRPEEVANMLRNLPDPELQAAAAKELSSQWQRRDSRGYQAWVAGLQAGPLRTALLSGGQQD